MTPEQAHIVGQARLREQTTAAVSTIWQRLGSYDRSDIAAWLAGVLPIVLAAQRASAVLTNAFVARSIGSTPLPVDPAKVVGAAVRAGTPPEVVYERPFVTVWSALGDGVRWEDAVLQGLARAVSAAEMDVQLTMRETLRVVGEEELRITGYARVPDGNACTLCLLASTQRYRTGELMPIHNRCGCGVRVLTQETGQVVNRRLLDELKLSGQAGDLALQRSARQARQRAAAARTDAVGARDPARRRRLEQRADAAERTAEEYRVALARRRAERDGARVGVRDHGELGPLLVHDDQHFTSEAALAA